MTTPLKMVTHATLDRCDGCKRPYLSQAVNWRHT